MFAQDQSAAVIWIDYLNMFLIIAGVCKELCETGEGGSLCICDTQPPARNSDLRDDPGIITVITTTIFVNMRNNILTWCNSIEQDKSILNNMNNLYYIQEYTLNEIHSPRQTASTRHTKVNPRNFSGLCVDLCRTGEGGSLCICDTQPPARNN